MPRHKPDTATSERMWSALLHAAKRHHGVDKDFGMTTVIAKDAGVTKGSVSNWKTGRTFPSGEAIRRLADLYGVSAQHLAGEDVPSGKFGPPDDLLRRAGDITELVVTELLPNGTTDQFLGVMRRAHELLLQGRPDSDVRGQLFLEVSRQKQKSREAPDS